MKILQVGSSLHDWGGIERYLVYLTQGLSERGHEVWTTVPARSPMESRLAGTKVHLSLRRQFQFSLLPAYMRLYRQQRFDLVNVHFSPDFIVPAIAAKFARQKNMVLTRHVVLYWSAGKVRRYSRLFDQFIGVSDAVSTRLAKSGIPAARLQTVLSGCPALAPTLDMETARGGLGVSGFSAGFFGRMVDDKGIRTIVEAAQTSTPDTFHAFGDGPLLGELSPKGAVRFHGRVEDVANAMQAMDAVVVPSMWEEAFGFSALEAMSLGKPVIATRSGGLPELVRDGETGILFDKGDASALSEAVTRLKNNRTEANRLGQAGKELHRSTFTVADMSERMERAYASIIDRKSSASG